jgi:thioredoxin-dependent peroxiredoxin
MGRVHKREGVDHVSGVTDKNLPVVGRQAPDFTLPSSSGGTVSLSGLRGKKVVIYFYPKDLTPTCTQQSEDFRDHYGEFQALGIELIGISTDPIKSHHKFIAKHALPFPLLSDTERKVCEQYGVWKLKKTFGHEYMGIERSTFLIDEKGKLVREWRNVRLKNHIQEVLNAVK